MTTALLTWTLGDADNPHGELLLGMGSLLFFLWVEAQRYRSYDVWPSRLRMLERNLFAPALGRRGPARVGLVNLVTFQDAPGAIVKHPSSAGEPQDLRVMRRPDGSWLLDSTRSTNELGEVLGLGDRFEWGGHSFQVVDNGGRRVDRVLVSRIDGTDRESAGESA